MAEILCRTKGGAAPKGKPRVWFSCHSADFENCFKKICDDLFEAQDCAVYYTPDMTAAIAEQDQETDLGSNNLFVIPVTRKLLTEPSRTMDVDFPYARAHHIPVLPVVMEPGLDELYSQPEKFGALHYLNPCSKDATEVSYAEKVRKYLESVLTDNGTASRIRAAFNGYVFLSYRKKDRRYANRLMRLIHSIPQCQDLAVWYDEFLTPGKDFREGIVQVLQRSRLFTLLVTPNLLEEPDGKPNFVMGQEYPAARDCGVRILPVEMEATDTEKLREKYEGIPPCVTANDTEAFCQSLLTAMAGMPDVGRSEDPEHLFLMGLAYLGGIDVEVDRARGVELISAAAQQCYEPAMMKLLKMYYTGDGVKADLEKAMYWARKMEAHYIQSKGLVDQDTLRTLSNLAGVYWELGQVETAASLFRVTFLLQCDVLGKMHPDTMATLNNLAVAYRKAGKHQEALQMHQLAQEVRQEQLGEDHPDTILSMSNLAQSYEDLQELEQAYRWRYKALELWSRIFGNEDPTTLTMMGVLARSCADTGRDMEALRLREQILEVRQKQTHRNPGALTDAIYHLANVYAGQGNWGKAITYYRQVWDRQQQYGAEIGDMLVMVQVVLYGLRHLKQYDEALHWDERAVDLSGSLKGKNHPDTLEAMHNMAYDYQMNGDLTVARQIYENLIPLRIEVLGERDYSTACSMMNMALCCSNLNRHAEAVGLAKRAYGIFCAVLTQDDFTLLEQACNCARVFDAAEDRVHYLAILEELYRLSEKLLGRGHRDTLDVLEELSFEYYQQKRFPEAQEHFEILYNTLVAERGSDHPDTVRILSNLANLCYHMENYGRAAQLYKILYSICAKQQGQDHAETLEILFFYARSLEFMGQIAQAAESAQVVYDRRVKNLGPHHDDTAATAILCFQLWDQLEQPEKSVPMKQAVYQYYLQKDGEAAAVTIGILTEVAEGLYGLDHLEEARDAYEQLYRSSAACYGPTHEYTMNALDWTAYLCVHCGEDKKAVALFRKLYQLRCRVLGPNHEKTLQTLEDIQWAETSEE